MTLKVGTLVRVSIQPGHLDILLPLLGKVVHDSPRLMADHGLLLLQRSDPGCLQRLFVSQTRHLKAQAILLNRLGKAQSTGRVHYGTDISQDGKCFMALHVLSITVVPSVPVFSYS